MKNMKFKRWLRCGLCAAILLYGFAFAEAGELTKDAAFVKRLNELGYCSLADNSSETQIRAAIEDFQLANGMQVTGEADERTQSALQSEAAVSKGAYLNRLAEELEGTGTLASGSYGEPVERMQEALHTLGYFDEICDGSYDDTTEFAVSCFQLANGLVETGIADKTVLYRLYNGAAETWDEFVTENTASVGDEGENVRLIQICLKHMGCFEGECTAVYGEQTQQAVKRYQNGAELEATGNVDPETARHLFPDAVRALSAGATVRRGDSGKRAAEMCEKLRLLGYSAHESFDLQTELALMRFQAANGFEVTGEADSATMAAIRLQAQDGAAAALPDGSALRAADEEIRAGVLRQARALLGNAAEFDDDFALAQYAYLKCGVLLEDADADQPVPLPEGSPLPEGMAVRVTADSAQMWGITTPDGAVILCGDGYIVMRYLNSMNVEEICAARSLL